MRNAIETVGDLVAKLQELPQDALLAGKDIHTGDEFAIHGAKLLDLDSNEVIVELQISLV